MAQEKLSRVSKYESYRLQIAATFQNSKREQNIQMTPENSTKKSTNSVKTTSTTTRFNIDEIVDAIEIAKGNDKANLSKVREEEKKNKLIKNLIVYGSIVLILIVFILLVAVIYRNLK